MNSMNHTAPSDSSREFPDGYQTQAPGYQPKNAYRHLNNHHQGHQQYATPMNVVNGLHYPAALAAPNNQYYPPMPTTGPGYVPVYAPGVHGDHTPYYLVSGPGGWAMQGPVPFYQHTFNGSPPGTPPQMHMPYSYPVAQRADQDFYTSSPPMPGPVPHVMHINPPPPLEHPRRNSWSSSGSDSPTTPFPLMADPTPTIVGEPHLMTVNHGSGEKSIEDMVNSGPPIPAPVHGNLLQYPTRQPTHPVLDNPSNTTNVYVRGLPPDTDDDKLLEMTARFGRVTSHKAIMDTEHGTCKGYGFARYETIEEAANCIQGLIARNYEAGFARESFNARLKTLADPSSTNIYVSNLPRDMNEKDMQEIFADYVVVSNRILRDAHGCSRGVGFARFESRDICDEIIKKFHGKPVGPDNLSLQVRYADTSAQKRLKATTTKKRQYRANEYNSIVNGGYWNMPAHHHLRGGNRFWLRQNSIGSSGSHESGVPLPHQLNKNRHWVNSQDWQPGNDENRRTEWAPRSSWRHSSGGSHDARMKLETVHENRDTSNVTVQNGILDGLLASGASRASIGSFSDPGDSYGGREYNDDGVIV